MDKEYDLTNPYEIARYIGEAEKSTPALSLIRSMNFSGSFILPPEYAPKIRTE